MTAWWRPTSLHAQVFDQVFDQVCDQDFYQDVSQGAAYVFDKVKRANCCPLKDGAPAC